MSPIKVKPLRMLLVCAALLATLSVAQGGHELPVYPSYYPHEIAIETMPPQRAADLLGDAKLHAYVSRRPLFPDAVPSSVRAVESLGSFVIVRLNPEHIVEDERSACSAVDAILREMAGKGGFVFHPYPVTPCTGIISTTSIKRKPKRRGCSERRPPHLRTSCRSGRTV